MSRGCNWCFTLNNYVDEDGDKLLSLKENRQVRYLIYGQEVGEGGTPHLQGYIVFHNQKKFDQVKKFLPEKVHIEKAKGSAKQNIAYCSKDGKVVEFGEIPQQGKRNDIEQVKDQIKKGAPLNKIVMEATSYQSARHAELLYKYQVAPKPQKRTIRWYYGESGSGKTRSAVEEFDDFYMSMATSKWWDGYYGQKHIIIDDLREDWVKFNVLLRILDRYPYRFEMKGSSMYIQPSTTHITITAPYYPCDVYKTNYENIDQLIRRIDEIKLFEIVLKDNSQEEDIIIDAIQ